MSLSLTIHPYRLPLICPLRLAGEEMTERAGWLIEVSEDNGKKGWGEIAPLPGSSSAEELRVLREWDGERVDGGMVTPSVRCGMDMALFDLGNPRMMPTALRVLQPADRDVPVNALLIGELEDMLKQAQAAVREGYRTLKIKVGRQSPADEIRLLQAINHHVPDHVRFRLDANRAWTPDRAERYLDVFSEMNLEYIEEPFPRAQDSLAWSRGTGVPVALDESLRDIAPAELHDFAGLRAVVLKPTLLGGLARSAELAAAARAMGAYPVVSAMLESGLGIAALARFAAAICDEDTAVGLDTYRWLAKDLLYPRLTFAGGMLPVACWTRDQHQIVLDLA
jgi:o-succinylbenzoate synthase